MVEPHNAGWRALVGCGFGDLSAPEAEHALLELPTNRVEYVGVLQDIADYPNRSPIGHRIPGDDEVAALTQTAGRWRAVVSLEDERALKSAAGLFNRVFVLDPMYDSGALLYAAWHDPLIRDEHSRRLARHGGLLIRAARLLKAGTAILAPEHLPGSWNPRPGWRKPRRFDDPRQVAAWAMRTSLVLLYWADRLDGVVCTAQDDVIAALDVVLGARATWAPLELCEPSGLDEAQTAREALAAELCESWAAVRRLSRRRTRKCLEGAAWAVSGLSKAMRHTSAPRSWRMVLGQPWVPEPAMLIRRVLNGQHPERDPRLPRKKLKRRPLCLLPA